LPTIGGLGPPARLPGLDMILLLCQPSSILNPNGVRMASGQVIE
jgi:hypothetical protein